MAKYYAVKEGKVPGIYTDWSECEEQIRGFSGAKYKKFATREEAEEFVGIGAKKEPEVTLDKGDKLYAYVDGSFNENGKVAGYGLVLVKNDQVLYKDLGAFKNMEMIESRNVLGEIRGALKAVELALANDFKQITIVYDYMGIECWATNQWKANKVLTQDYRDFMQKYMKVVDISFEKVKAHSGVKYNEMADLLAKKAVGIA